MPRFKCSYAYDVPHYFDFTVEAADEAEAEKKIAKALEDGVFGDHDDKASPCYENADDARVFVSGQDDDELPDEETMFETLIEQHKKENE
jgi:hypothetical protein